ncbi:hypothetical protein Acor_76640 [Acrocarpospora corrugata]|uniref:LexA repressor DNA-binding domain-containing protein n=1 Tax=Acrocarpospora corrugata TaxID=35763 RepID=A0A5M3W9U2_9ACTN|nr:hypothetical protein [Acrocarpospora corrugata]GES05596.1 hypothetical protein Acor_76640 [Acrocarpospora corrugata]
MTSSQPRKPTPAQRAVLERIRDEEVHHNPLSPRRSGIPRATLAVLRTQGWIMDGEDRPVDGRRLLLTDSGRAVLDFPAPRS